MGTSKSFALSGVRVGSCTPRPPTRSPLWPTSPERGRRFTAPAPSPRSPPPRPSARATCGGAVRRPPAAHARPDRQRLNAIDGISCRCPEGTYLAFPDVGALGLDAEAFAEGLLREAKVAVVPGTPRWFGPGAEVHVRMSFATSEAILTEALDRIEDAVRNL